MRPKSADDERSLVTRGDQRRPYGAKITFQLMHSANMGELENVTLLLDSGAVATIKPGRSASWEGGRRFTATLEGFRTATVAETEGLRLAQALLLAAISMNFGLRLNYRAHEPAVVYERFRSVGITAWGEGVTGWPQSIVLTELVGASAQPLLDRSLILSMELFCAAFLETNERARFVTVVSALEPLAKQQSLGPAVSSVVDDMLATFDNAEGMPIELPILRARKDSAVGSRVSPSSSTSPFQFMVS